MNPADVAQQALPVASGVSLIELFFHAHWVVKLVMLGLLTCSVWVWAIAIDKWFLYARTKRAMDRFEQAFWSGESLEELYRSLSAKPTTSMPALFVAAMREWKRSFESSSRTFAGLQTRIEKVMDVSIAREIDRLERRDDVWKIAFRHTVMEWSGTIPVAEVPLFENVPDLHLNGVPSRSREDPSYRRPLINRRRGRAPAPCPRARGSSTRGQRGRRSAPPAVGCI